MTWILLEALGAGLLLVLIVWWTMFSGRDRGELRQDAAADSGVQPADEPDAHGASPAPQQSSPVDRQG